MHIENAFVRRSPPEQGLRDFPSGACEAEARDLLVMADILAEANAALAAKLDDWRRRVNELLAGPITDSLSTVQRLEALAMDLRRQWIDLAQSVVAGELKSPPVGRLPLLPISPSFHYIYERVLSPHYAQKRLQASEPVIPGWDMNISLFNSGMAAITTAITVLRQKKAAYCPADQPSLRLEMFGGYFETQFLLDLLSTSDLSCQASLDLEGVLDRFSSGETDILFLELIAYDWKQTVVDPARLLDAIARRPADRPWILMVDNTLLGPVFKMGPLLAACGEKKPMLALEVRSGLKLDQAGLEFTNVGIVKTLSPDVLDKSQQLDAAKFRQGLVSARKRLGTGLSLSQMSILDAPWIFHRELTEQRAEAVFDNNRRLAFALARSNKLFAKVNHPGLSSHAKLSWAESPLVVMEFHAQDDNEENTTFLLGIIAHEVRRRNLVLYLGASFGFRHHRCEVVEPSAYTHPNGQAASFFKVAMGSRAGPCLEGTIKLLQELAAFGNFAALRRAYPNINPDREFVAFPDIQTVRLIRKTDANEN